ncbi:hypothetical protein [Parapedobacter tibetensis]|uniref:hypothetical protein n=1 Tax=Parapedobacter tibetensis TaxID=2972951 RepID=UPI002151FEA2|nr:hypothetical protein [Parapedobacter tibetensis]
MGSRIRIVCFVKGCRLHYDLDTAYRHLVHATADTAGFENFGMIVIKNVAASIVQMLEALISANT